MTAVSIFICAALLALLAGTLANLRSFRAVRPAGADFRPRKISVLVPARNESASIRACLESLQAQDWPDLEILMLDDQSEDDTASIARSLGFGETGRCRILQGHPLPEGWAGKCRACHQLAEAATGEVLFFTDADTVHEPGSVSASVAELDRSGAALLSMWPQQIMGTWSERLVLPLGYLLFVGLHPAALSEWILERPGRARALPRGFVESLGVANGQCMVFQRAAYDRIGGHAAIRDHLVDDVALGRRVAAHGAEGLRVINRDASRWIRCRMYRSFAELWSGFSKNLRPVFEENAIGFCLAGAALFSLFVLPFLLLTVSGPHQAWAAGACGLVLLQRVILTLRFRTSWMSVVLHPFAMALAMTIALNSWRWALTGRLQWKGRRYAAR